MISPPATSGPLQWPFIGLAVLLVLLILATPELIAVGPSAGSPQTVAVLILDQTPGANGTHFYVESLSVLRYTTITLGVAEHVSWPVPDRGLNLTWDRWSNTTESLVALISSPANPVAVNVTAIYIDPAGATAIYRGVYAFNTTGGQTYIESLLPGLDPGVSSLVLNSPEPLPLLATVVGG
jgi:hypothetical protein